MDGKITIRLSVRALIVSVLLGAVFSLGGIVFAQKATTTQGTPAAIQQSQQATGPELKISKITPSSGGVGQYITIEGVGFGSDVGEVAFVQKGVATPSDTKYPEQCDKLWWRDSYVIAKVPASLSSGSYEVKVKRAKDSRVSPPLKFVVTDYSAGVGICGLLPDNGPGGIAIEVYGVNFGDQKGRTRFAKVEGSIADTGWSSSRVAVAAPTATDSGNVVLVTAERDLSNPVPFRFSRCTSASCGSDETCCSDGSCKPKGACKEKVSLCRYSWNFYTGIRNRLGEACRKNEECVSGVCGPEKKCIRGSKGDDEPCGFDAECREGYKCDQGKCSSILKKIGQPCSQTSECASRMCLSGSCAQGAAAVGSACTHGDQCATLNCYQGSCGQTERCIKIESILPLPNEVTPRSVFSVVFNQLIDEQSGRTGVKIEPPVKSSVEIRTVGTGDAARSQIYVTPLEPLSQKMSYAVRVDKIVKSKTSANTVEKCVTGDQKQCTSSGMVCSLDGSLCTSGARCTGVGSQCNGSGTVCTGRGSKCDNGATCIGQGSTCSGTGTNCLGDGSICKLGATCHGKNSKCVDPQSICKGDGSTCRDGAQCPGKGTQTAAEECKQTGQVCAAAGAQCSATGTVCTGAGSQCTNGAQCTGADAKCSGTGTQCPGSNSQCLQNASCPNPQQTGKGPGQACGASSECGSGVCNTAAGVCTGGPGGPGSLCSQGGQCSSGVCQNGKCGENPGGGPISTPTPSPTPGPSKPCPDGWTLCGDDKCYHTDTCPSNVGPSQCNTNNQCEDKEGCSCSDCQGTQDSCRDGLVCRPQARLCTSPTCGNKAVDSITEQCDDGNIVDDDACSNNCKIISGGGPTPSPAPTPIPAVKPATPTGLTAVKAPHYEASEINISWNPVPEATGGYTLERKRGSDPAITRLQIPIPTHLTSYADRGLNNATKYFYRLIAANSAGESDPTAWVEETTDRFELCIFESAPTAPTNLTATVISSSQIDLSWTDASTNESHFEIQRSESGREGEFLTIFPVGHKDGTGYRFTYPATGLKKATKYYFKIIAKNCKGLSELRGDATTGAAGSDPASPASPVCGNGAPEIGEDCDGTNLRDESCTSINAGFIGGTLSCSTICTFKVNSCTLPPRIQSECGNNIVEQGEFCDGADLRGTTCASLGIGFTEGALSCRSKTDANKCTFDLSGCLPKLPTTTPIIKPATPTGLTAIKAPHYEASQINISWNPVPEALIGYYLERKHGTDPAITRLQIPIPTHITSYADRGLSNGSKYFYRIISANSAGESDPSAWVEASTDLFELCIFESAPQVPTNLTATVISSSQIDLSWTDASTNESHFEIQRSESGREGEYESIFAVAPKERTGYTFSFPSTSLKANTKYYYRVLARNCKGANSANGDATTLADGKGGGDDDTIVTTDRLDRIAIHVNRSQSPIALTFKDEFKCISGCADDSSASAGNQHLYEVRAYNASGQRTADLGVVTWSLQSAHAKLLATNGTTTAITVDQPVIASGDTLRVIVKNRDGSIERERLIAFDTNTASPPAPAAVNYALSITRNGSGFGLVTSTPAGVDCGSTCATQFAKDMTVQLRANPSAGSIFGGWAGACANLTGMCSLSMASDKSVTALFLRNDGQSHTLSISKAGTGSGSVTSTPAGIDCGSGAGCQGTFASATRIKLTATTSSNSIFTGWTAGDANFVGWAGGYTATSPTTEFIFAADTSLTANFALNDGQKHTLSITKPDAGSGTVTGSVSTSTPTIINCGQDCSELVDSGTTVTLTAAADPSSTFVGWSGGGCTTVAGAVSTACTVVIASDTAVSARFVPRTLSKIQVLKVSTSSTETLITRDTFTCARTTGCADDTISSLDGNQHTYRVRAYEKLNTVDASLVYEALPLLGLPPATVAAINRADLLAKISQPTTPSSAYTKLLTVTNFPTTGVPTEAQFLAVLDALVPVPLKDVRWSMNGSAGSLLTDQNDKPKAVITASNVKNAGDSTLSVDVEGYDSFKGTASVFIANEQCDYPWEYASSDYDLRLYYCRGNGSEPLLAEFKKPPISRTPTDSAFQSEYIFQMQDPSTSTAKVDPNNTDVFVLRAANNTGWKPLSEWYRTAAKLTRSNPQSFEVQGYQAIRDAYGAFVRAPGRSSATAPWNPYIINFTTNTTASKPTRDLVDQLMRTADFSVSAAYNQSDYESEGMKLRRDIVRLSHLQQLEYIFDSAQVKPKLESGSYIKGQSISAWKSWNSTLGNTLKTALPVDPYYTSSQSQFGCSDAAKCSCPNVGAFKYDTFTCWDDKANSGAGKFAFSGVIEAAAQANTHAYSYESIAEGYRMCVKFEGPTTQQFAGLTFTNESGRVCRGCGLFGGQPCTSPDGSRTSCAPTLSVVNGNCTCKAREIYRDGVCKHCGERGEPVCESTDTPICKPGSWNKNDQGTCAPCGEVGESLCPSTSAGPAAGPAVGPSGPGSGGGSTGGSTTGCSGNLVLVGEAPNQVCACSGRTIYSSTAKTCIACGGNNEPICTQVTAPAKECDDWRYNKNNGGVCKECGKEGQPICPAGAGVSAQQCSEADELKIEGGSCALCPPYTNFASGGCSTCGQDGTSLCRTPHTSEKCRATHVESGAQCACPSGTIFDAPNFRCIACGTLTAPACASGTACNAGLYNDAGYCRQCGHQAGAHTCPVPPSASACQIWLTPSGSNCVSCGKTNDDPCPAPATNCDASLNLVLQGGKCNVCPQWSFYSSAACMNCGHLDEIICPSGAQCDTGLVSQAISGTTYCKGPDTTPDDFSIAPVADSAINATHVSSEITVSGVNTPVDVTLTGDLPTTYSYTINGSAPSASQKVSNGDRVVVTMKASARNLTAVKTILGIGTLSRDFVVTTRGCIPGSEILTSSSECVTCGDDNHRVCAAPANQCHANHATYYLRNSAGTQLVEQGLFCAQCGEYQRQSSVSGEGCLFNFLPAIAALNTCTECKTQGWMDLGLTASQISSRGTDSAARQEHRYYHWRALTSQWVEKSTLALAQGDVGANAIIDSNPGADGTWGTSDDQIRGDDDTDSDTVIVQDECIGLSGPYSNYGCPTPSANISISAPEFKYECKSTGAESAITERGANYCRVASTSASVKVWWTLSNAQGTVSAYYKWGPPGNESEIQIGSGLPLSIDEANGVWFDFYRDRPNGRIQINAASIGTGIVWLPILNLSNGLPDMAGTNTGEFTSDIIVSAFNAQSVSIDGISTAVTENRSTYSYNADSFSVTIPQVSPAWYVARIRHAGGNQLLAAIFKPIGDSYGAKAGQQGLQGEYNDTCGSGDVGPGDGTGGWYDCSDTESGSCRDYAEKWCAGGVIGWSAGCKINWRDITCHNNKISAPSGYRY